MGLFRIVLEATGGHGCQRDKGDGDKVYPCYNRGCPDCLVHEFVEKLSKIANVSKAELIHWPDAEKWGGKPIVDEYVMDQRSVYPYDRVVNWETRETVPDHGIQVDPAHRIRHGFFPDHPSMNKGLPPDIKVDNG